MNRLLPILLCLLAACLPPGAHAQQPDGQDDILQIRSNGKTRIEIHSGEQVALYTGGVQFEYRDYRLSADRLMYREAESYAEATGNVLLEQDGSRLATERIEMYIDESLLRCPGELRGALAKGGLSFRAATANVTLSEQPGGEPDSYRIELAREVWVESGEGYRFFTSLVTMDTASGLVSVPREFTLQLPSGNDAPGQAFPMGDLLLTGISMEGRLNDEMQLESLHALSPELRGEQLQFNAGSIKAGFTDNGHGGVMVDLLASGSPVRGMYLQPGRDISFSADSISGTIDPGFTSQFLLSGSIDLSSDLSLLQSDTLRITQDGQGVRIIFPEGFEAGMDLAEMTGNEDVDLSDVLHR